MLRNYENLYWREFMKFTYFFSFVCILFGVLGTTGYSATLVPAKKIQINVLENSLDLNLLKVTAQTSCTYKTYGWWSETKSCGNRETPAEITSSGELVIPAVESFGNVHGRNLDNFVLNVYVTDKNTDEVVFSLGIRFKENFKKYIQSDDVLNVLKFKDTEVTYTVEEKPLAGSEISQNQRSEFFVFLKRSFENPSDANGILLVDSLESKSFDNFDHGYPVTALRDVQTVRIHSGTLIEFAKTPGRYILYSTLKMRNMEQGDPEYKSQIEIAKTVNGLSQIRNIDLKKVK